MVKIENKLSSDWKINSSEIENLNHIKLMLEKPIEYYKKRILKIGFYGKDTSLLDAACGSGIMSVPAAQLNSKVFGVDGTERYLDIARKINHGLKINNLSFNCSKLEKMPYKNGFFDYVICYDAWMYTNRKKSLEEMVRVLKPGGKIYLGAIAGLGWYLSLFTRGIKTGDRRIFFQSLSAIKNRVFMTKKECLEILKTHKLKILGVGPDGSLGDKKIKIKPFFRAKILGFWCVFEIMAQK